jgi:hypothetical protein
MVDMYFADEDGNANTDQLLQDTKLYKLPNTQYLPCNQRRQLTVFTLLVLTATQIAHIHRIYYCASS